MTDKLYTTHEHLNRLDFYQAEFMQFNTLSVFNNLCWQVYACGEGSKGRLGLGHSNNVSVPQLIKGLSQYVIKKVAIHSVGKHCLAINTAGRSGAGKLWLFTLIVVIYPNCGCFTLIVVVYPKP